jgi:hypothetical protein
MGPAVMCERVHQVRDRMSRRQLPCLAFDRFESMLDDIGLELRAQTWKLMTLMVLVVGVVVAAVRL